MNNWVCVYVDSVAIEDIKKFDLAVLDADAHPNLAPLRDSSTLPVGYLSLGEIADYRWYWDLISTKSWVLDKNPNWGSHFVRKGIQMARYKIIDDHGIYFTTHTVVEWLPIFREKRYF